LARAHGEYVGSGCPHHKYLAALGKSRMAAGAFRLGKSAVSDAVTLTLPQGLGLMLAGGSIQLRVAPMSLTLLAPSPEPAISASPSLTREQKRQIRETFAVIEPASDLVARLFYMKSIDLDPSLGKLFKSPSRAQRRKFMAAMKVAVLSLDRLQSLQPILKLLGTRQREAGVKPSHYDAFQHAWVWTLEQSLQPRFPSEAKEAWSSLLGEMTRATAS
jgi:hemoglobin-like flavoprotein